MRILMSLRRHLVLSLSKSSNKVLNLVGNLYRTLGTYISASAKI